MSLLQSHVFKRGFLLPPAFDLLLYLKTGEDRKKTGEQRREKIYLPLYLLHLNWVLFAYTKAGAAIPCIPIKPGRVLTRSIHARI